MTRVGVTCIQLLRDLDAHRGPFDERSWEVATPLVAGQHLEGAELVAGLDGCIGVVAGDDKFTADVMDALPMLRVISKWGIGIDGIDLGAAAERDIVVRNTPGMFDDEVADVTMAYVVMLDRHLAVIDRGIREGRWPKPAGTSLSTQTLGIIGLGGIGRAVAKRAAVSGMRILGVDPSAESCAMAAEHGVAACDLDALLANSDVISVNAPLNPATFHLLDAVAFTKMRLGVRIVNTGRGPVIDTDALVDALSSGQVGGCAVDVLEEEPPPIHHPLRQFEQVVFGSHNASNTLEASARTHDVAISHLIDEIEQL